MALRHTFSPRGGIRPDGSQGRPCVGHFRQGSRRAVAWTARGPRAPRIRRSPGHPRGAARRDRVAGRRQPLRDRRVDRPRRPQGRPDGGQPGRLQPAGRARRDGVGRPGRPDRQAPQPPPLQRRRAGRRRPAARAAARSTTPPSSTPASPTAAASPRPRRSSSARTSTRSTGACATPASARSTPPTRRCATATTSSSIRPRPVGDSLQPVAGPARRTGRAQPRVAGGRRVARLRALVGAILTATLVLAFAVPASANGGHGGTAKVRAFHNSPDTPAVDIYVNGAKTLSDVTYGTLSDYLEVPGGPTTSRSRWPRPPRDDPAALEADVRLGKRPTTIAAIGSLDRRRRRRSSSRCCATSTPISRYLTRLRVAHTSPDAPAVDVQAKAVRPTGSRVVRGLEFGEATRLPAPPGLEVPAADRRRRHRHRGQGPRQGQASRAAPPTPPGRSASSPPPTATLASACSSPWTADRRTMESVWDYPRPPRVEPSAARVVRRVEAILGSATTAYTPRPARCSSRPSSGGYYGAQLGSPRR